MIVHTVEKHRQQQVNSHEARVIVFFNFRFPPSFVVKGGNYKPLLQPSTIYYIAMKKYKNCFWLIKNYENRKKNRVGGKCDHKPSAHHMVIKKLGSIFSSLSCWNHRKSFSIITFNVLYQNYKREPKRKESIAGRCQSYKTHQTIFLDVIHVDIDSVSLDWLRDISTTTPRAPPSSLLYGYDSKQREEDFEATSELYLSRLYIFFCLLIYILWLAFKSI